VQKQCCIYIFHYFSSIGFNLSVSVSSFSSLVSCGSSPKLFFSSLKVSLDIGLFSVVGFSDFSSTGSSFFSSLGLSLAKASCSLLALPKKYPIVSLQ